MLTGASLGLILGTQIANWVQKRFGSRAALIIGAVLFFGAPPFAAVVHTPLLMALVLFVMGCGNGAYDVGEGLQKTNFELLLRADHPRLRDANIGIEALFSLGSVLGTGSAAVAIAEHWNTLAHLTAISVTAMVAVLLVARNLPPAPEREPRPPERRRTTKTEPVTASSLAFAAMCVVSFFSGFPIGIAYAWSVPFLQSIGARSWVTVGALLAYTVCEGIGRMLIWLPTVLSGSRRHRLHVVGRGLSLITRDKRRTVIVGGVLGLAGAALIVGPARPVPAIVGFGLLSLGLGPSGPIIQSTANHSAQVRHRGLRMSLLTSSFYLGGIIGQPLVAGIQQLSSIRTGMALLVVSMAVVLALVRVVPSTRPRHRKHARHRRPTGR